MTDASTSSDAPVRSRLRELDVLRGVAALAVVVFHYLSQYNETYGHSSEMPLRNPYGMYGVHLFFIISGFVIFMTLERAKRPIDFIFGRCLRLYPAYWMGATVAAFCLATGDLPGASVSLKQFLANLTMVQGGLGFEHLDEVYWTLTYELRFYVVGFAIFLFGWQKNIVRLCIVWTLMSIVQFSLSAEARQHTAWLNGVLLLEFNYLFVAGMLFYQHHKGRSTPATHAAIALSLVACWLCQGSEIALFSVGFYYLFYLLAADRLGFLISRPMVWLGSISYPLYLVHQKLGYVIIHRGYEFGFSPWLSILAATIGSFAVAVLVHYGADVPASAWGRRRWKRMWAEESPFTRRIPGFLRRFRADPVA